jgi:hypothetical protein
MTKNTLDLLQFSKTLTLRLAQAELRGDGAGGRLAGAIELSLGELADGILPVQVRRVGLYSLDLAQWQNTTGSIRVTASSGEGSITADGTRLQLTFSSDVSYAELTKDGYQNLVQQYEGVRVAPTHQFSASLGGAIEPGDGIGALQVTGVSLTFRGVDPTGAPMNLLIESTGLLTAAPPPSLCPGAQMPGKGGVIQVRKIYFRNTGLQPVETGRFFALQLQNANAEWKRCCLQIVEASPPVEILNSPAWNSNSVNEIIAAIDPQYLVGPAVPVICAAQLASGDGGGAFEGGSILLSEGESSTNFFLLAHELGHYLGLGHTNAADIMYPGGASLVVPPPNSVTNCQNINFARVLGVMPCCWAP